MGAPNHPSQTSSQHVTSRPGRHRSGLKPGNRLRLGQAFPLFFSSVHGLEKQTHQNIGWWVGWWFLITNIDQWFMLLPDQHYPWNGNIIDGLFYEHSMWEAVVSEQGKDMIWILVEQPEPGALSCSYLKTCRWSCRTCIWAASKRLENPLRGFESEDHLLSSGKHTKSYWKWPWIVHLSIQKGNFL